MKNFYIKFKSSFINPNTNDSWRQNPAINSLSEVHASIIIPERAGFWRTLRAFAGPGLLVAVGYMDPGNWATDIAGGARFGYTLLSVILISNLFAMFLQHLALKLGIATGRDLAQACRESYSPAVVWMLWILCEIAIAACDLAEVLGSAIALQLLFGIDLPWGVAITIVDVLLILMLQKSGFRLIEAIVGSLILIIGGCFVYELVVSAPPLGLVAKGLVPSLQIVSNPGMLYLAIGILGATVMPHNLYLHSGIVQTRAYKPDHAGRKQAIRFATIDSTFCLFIAFFVNAAILILSAAVFYDKGMSHIADITDAYKLLDPLLGVQFAGILFAVALLAAGQNSTLTATLAGQIVMEGFINIRLKPWLRRLITRLFAVVPAFIIALLYGQKGVTDLLVFSQIILSLQLSFAVIPLVQFTSNKDKMNGHANSKTMQIAAWIIALLILSLNMYMVAQFYS